MAVVRASPRHTIQLRGADGGGVEGGVVPGQVLGQTQGGGGGGPPPPVSACNFGSCGENKMSMNVSSGQFSHTFCPDLLSLGLLPFFVQVTFFFCQTFLFAGFQFIF